MFSIFKFSIVIAIASLGFYGLRKWFDGGVCESTARLDGKTVVITGGNTGIGKESAIDLAKRGAKVIIACRSKQRGNDALVDIKEKSGSENVHLRLLDLASFASIHAFADDFKKSESRLDILINNAGIMGTPFQKTEDGFEIQFGVNHIGHFLLTNLLLGLIEKSAPSRIIMVSSLAHRFLFSVDFTKVNDQQSYSRTGAYAVSKLANVLFAKELSKRVKGKNISVFSLHPGSVKTEIGRHWFNWKFTADIIHKLAEFTFLKSAKQGAETTNCCAVQEGLEKFTGEYFADCKVATMSDFAKNETLAKQLWDLSVEWTNLKD